MESEGDGDGAEDRQRQERKEGRSYHDDYRHNPSFGSIILEDLYTSSGRIIILPIGGYLHILTFLSDMQFLGLQQGDVPHFFVKLIPCSHSQVGLMVCTQKLNRSCAGSLPHQWWNAPICRRP